VLVQEGARLHGKATHLQVAVGDDRRELPCTPSQHLWATPVVFHNVGAAATLGLRLLSKSVLHLPFLDDELGTCTVDLDDEDGEERWFTLADAKGLDQGRVKAHIDVDGRGGGFFRGFTICRFDGSLPFWL